MILLRLLGVLVLVFCLLGTAHAEAEKMALLVSGTATAHERELAGSTFEAIARSAGLAVARPNFTAREASAVNACVTAAQAWSCVAPAVRGKGLDHVAIISLAPDTGPDSSPMVVITEQILVARLDAAVVLQRFCIRCTDDVLTTTTSELTRSVLQEIAVRSGRTVVSITSTPRGARILFDGQSQGATDRSFNTFPGVHTVVVELDGYRQETRSIQAKLDRTTELSLVLRRLDAPAIDIGGSTSTSATPAHASIAPKIAIGVGALAIVAGGVVLALNQGPAVAPIGSEQPHHYRDTIAPGIGLMIGGAVVTVGGYLWWRHTKAPAVSVVPLPGGATVGVATSF